MDWIKGLQRAIDYMEEHMTEPISWDMTAAQMNISAFYFQRIFTMLCGFTPSEYIRNRRLALAGSELLLTDNKIIDIALKYGYDTPEGFTRAFTRFHGATPAAVRKGGASVRSFARLQISISLKGGNSMNYRIVEKEAFKVLEKAEVHPVVTDENKYEISDFWDRARADGTILRLMDSLAEGKSNLMGICYGDSLKKDHFEYSIAAECSESCIAPEGYRIQEIPARTWVVFECKGAMPHAIQDMWHRIITEFFPSSDYVPTCEMDIEDYPDGDVSSDDYKCSIWVPVRRK